MIGPDGSVRATTRGRPGVALGSVDLAEIIRSRAAVSHLADRRPEAYRAGAEALEVAPLAATG